MGKVKKFFTNIGHWFVNHAPTKRRIIQLYAALLYNANLKGYVTGKIFKGPTKNVCVPSMNCYSCPGAIAGCPLGALQNALGSAGHTAPYYMLGIVALFGVIFGRTICGWICPAGMLQELLYKIKVKKIKKSPITRVLTYLKYVFLVVFVMAIPIAYGFLGIADPGFCKYVCPVGTFEGAFGLILNPNNKDLYAMLGPLFTWKTFVLIVIIVASIFMYRPFCRFICPLGLIYGFFNRFSLIGVVVDTNKCTNCGLCVNQCKMDIRHVGDIECINCGECISVCPQQAITWKGSKFFLHENQLEPLPASNIKIDLVGTLPKIEKENVNLNENKPELIPTEAIKEEVKEEKPKKKGKQPLYDKKKVKYFNIGLFSVLTVMLATALLYFNVFDKTEETISGDVCPSFVVNTLNGTEDKFVYDNSRPQEKITIINFWATWCGNCVKELPEFNRFQNDYEDHVNIVAIDEYGDNGIDMVKEDFKDFTITFAEDNKDNEVFKSLGGGDALPYTVIVNTKNEIVYKKTGSVTYSELKNEVSQLIPGFVSSFEIKSLNGNSKTYKFDSNKTQEKITIINFWATWCGNCVKELPEFNRFQNDYKDHVNIVAIDEYGDSGIDLVQSDFNEYAIQFAEDNKDNAVFKSLGGGDALPYTVIVNYNNFIVKTKTGSMSYDELKAEIDSILKATEK